MYFPDGLSKMTSTTKVKDENFSGKLAVDYDFSDRTTMGFQLVNDRNNPDFKSDISIDKYTIQNQLRDITKNNSFTDKGSGNQTYNRIDYEVRFSKRKVF